MIKLNFLCFCNYCTCIIFIILLAYARSLLSWTFVLYNFIAETPILKMSPTPQSSASVRSEKSEESILGRPSTREISAWSAGSICSATCRSVSAGAKLRILYPGQRAAGPRVAATLSNTIVISVSAVSWAAAVPFMRVGHHIYCASWSRRNDFALWNHTLRRNDFASSQQEFCQDQPQPQDSVKVLSEAVI